MTRGPWRSCAIAFVGLVFLSGIFTALLSQPLAQAANPVFVQARSKQITTGTVNSLAFTQRERRREPHRRLRGLG